MDDIISINLRGDVIQLRKRTLGTPVLAMKFSEGEYERVRIYATTQWPMSLYGRKVKFNQTPGDFPVSVMFTK